MVAFLVSKEAVFANHDFLTYQLVGSRVEVVTKKVKDARRPVSPCDRHYHCPS